MNWLIERFPDGAMHIQVIIILCLLGWVIAMFGEALKDLPEEMREEDDEEFTGGGRLQYVPTGGRRAEQSPAPTGTAERMKCVPYGGMKEDE